MRTSRALAVMSLSIALVLSACGDDSPPAEPGTAAAPSASGAGPSSAAPDASSASGDVSSLESDREQLKKTVPDVIRQFAGELGVPATAVQGRHETCKSDTGGASAFRYQVTGLLKRQGSEWASKSGADVLAAAEKILQAQGYQKVSSQAQPGTSHLAMTRDGLRIQVSATSEPGANPIQISGSHPDVCVEVPKEQRGSITSQVDNL